MIRPLCACSSALPGTTYMALRLAVIEDPPRQFQYAEAADHGHGLVPVALHQFLCVPARGPLSDEIGVDHAPDVRGHITLVERMFERPDQPEERPRREERADQAAGRRIDR